MISSKDKMIIPLRLGTQMTYLIPAKDGFIMVDAGNRRCGGAFRRKLGRLKIRPEQIKLLILTHVHFDHVGTAAYIKKHTGCKVAVSTAESHLLESGQAVIPPGINWYGCLISRLGIGWGTHHFGFPGLSPDFVIENDFDLAEFGLNGRITPTPGHTVGSISVVLDTGEIFAGDAVIRYLPFLPPLLPPFGNDKKQMLLAWKILLESGARTIYPGHGWPMTASELGARYKRLLGRKDGDSPV